MEHESRLNLSTLSLCQRHGIESDCTCALEYIYIYICFASSLSVVSFCSEVLLTADENGMFMTLCMKGSSFTCWMASDIKKDSSSIISY